MISLKSIAFALAMTLAAAPVAQASPEPKNFTITFDYNFEEPAAENYAAFLRKARKACQETGKRGLDSRSLENACMADVLDAFVRKLGRDDLAAVHFDKTGRLVDSSRSLAAR